MKDMNSVDLKPAAGLYIVWRIRGYITLGYVKAVTLAGNCYVDYPGIEGTIKAHQIIDVVRTYEDYKENEKAGKYRL
ncbi:MAG TPA: hypothetical protein PKE39_04440 [Ignavibacteria bacterium]|nr:hypothetical protein [Ignavibacteria bacterium]HMQ98251.1 hypothetical protein [Ignavibacteria bacterium]